MVQVFKARYFHSKSFFDVNPSFNDSFVWKGFLAAKEVVSKGMMWRIDEGAKVDIWQDHWLLDLSNPKPTSVVLPGLEDYRVNIRLAVDNKQRDFELINDMFNKRDRSLITRILISLFPKNDRLFWAA